MLCRLSIQLPHTYRDASTLQSRAVSPYRYDLTRVKTPASTSIAKRQSIKDNARRAKYLFPITVEGQTLYLELDTGSSDTWIIRSDFECYTTFNSDTAAFTGSQSEEFCNFGPTYTPGAGFETIPYFGLLSCYGQSQFEDTLRCVNGSAGHVNLEFDGLIVQEQLVGAMEKASPCSCQVPCLTDSIVFIYSGWSTNRVRFTRDGHARSGDEQPLQLSDTGVRALYSDHADYIQRVWIPTSQPICPSTFS